MLENKKKLVPRLRFPEFRDAGPWEVRRLGELDMYISDGNYGELYPTAKEFVKKGIPFIRANNIKNLKIINDDMRYISKEKHQILKSGHLKEGDILVTTRGEIGEVAYVDKRFENANINAQICLVRTNSNIYNKYLLYQLVLNKKQFLKFQTGSTLKQLPKKNLSNIKIHIPPTTYEQQKIADCLSSLDEVIELEAKKLEALKAHKKGLMQQLFPREGETIPRLRFPEFRDAGPWEVKRLGDIIEEFKKQSTVQDEYEVLTSSRKGLLRQKEYYEENRITSRENIGFNIIPPNYITYRSRSDDRRFYFNENTLGITGIISVYYPVFRITEGSNKFIVEMLNHSWIEVGKHSVGTSQTVLSINELKRLKMPIPSPPEQQKIADCLSSIDEVIELEAKKLEALKAHKKGLMQRLFPQEVG